MFIFAVYMFILSVQMFILSVYIFRLRLHVYALCLQVSYYCFFDATLVLLPGEVSPGSNLEDTVLVCSTTYTVAVCANRKVGVVWVWHDYMGA